MLRGNPQGSGFDTGRTTDFASKLAPTEVELHLVGASLLAKAVAASPSNPDTWGCIQT